MKKLREMAMEDIGQQVRGLGQRGLELRDEFMRAFNERRIKVLDHSPADEEVQAMNAEFWITAGDWTYVTIKAEQEAPAEESKPAHTAPAADEDTVYVREAGSKFEYYKLTEAGKRDRQRLSTNGEYTHIVYARDPKGAGNWFIYSFHSRRDLADKKASSLSYPSTLGQWETTTYQTKVVEIQQG